MISSSSSTVPSGMTLGGTQSSRSGKSNRPVKDYFFFLTKKISLSSFRNLKYGLWGAIVVVITLQWYFVLFLSSSCFNYPSTNPISSRSDLSSSASKKVIGNDGFFSPYPYVFTEGCLGKLSESYAPPPYQQPKLLGDMHDHPTTNLTGVFDVPPDKSFMNTVIIVIDSLSRAQIMAYMPKVRQVLQGLHTARTNSEDEESPLHHDKELFSFLNGVTLEGTTPFFFSALLSGKEFEAEKEDRTWIQDELKEKGHAVRYFGRTWPISTNFQERFPEAISSIVPEGTLLDTSATKLGFTKDYLVTLEEIKNLVHCAEDSSSFCKRGDTEEFSLQVEHLRQFWKESMNSPKLAILHSAASHVPNTPESVAAYDTELATLLQNLIQSRNMNIMFFTDHGQLQDEYSFGFPLMAVILCKQALKNKERKENMIHNSERMVTMYDMHHTLRHLHLGDPEKEDREGVMRKFDRSMMVHKIEKNRSCNSAGVPPLVCPCFARSWRAVSPEREMIIKPELERLLREKQHPGGGSSCEEFEFQKINILSPVPDKTKKVGTTTTARPRSRRLAANMRRFIRAEIQVQKNVTFEARGYLMSSGVLLKDLRQTTSYRKFEVCTPEGGNPQFCICDYTKY